MQTEKEIERETCWLLTLIIIFFWLDDSGGGGDFWLDDSGDGDFFGTEEVEVVCVKEPAIVEILT